MGWASGFSAGSQMGRSIVDAYQNSKDYEDKQKRKEEIAAIVAAQPDQQTALTETNVPANMTYDSDTGTYVPSLASVVANQGTDTPESAPQLPTFGAKTTTNFLGKSYDTAPTDAAIAGARQQAMAGVMEKYGDPEAAVRYRQQAQQGILTGMQIDQGKELFGWARDNQEVLKKQRVRDEAFNAEREKIMASSPYVKVEQANQAAQADYQRQLAEYNKAKTAPGMEARDMGPAPVAPALSAVTPGQEIEHYARLFSNELGAGRVSAESAIKFHQMVNQVKNEGYGQALTLANSGAPLEKVAESFNKNGSVKFDPASVISDKMVKNADGLPSRVIQFKGADGSVHTIDALAELNAIGAADKVYTRFYQNKADTRADTHLDIASNQNSRAQQVFDIELPVHQANADVAELKSKLAETEDPKEQAKLSEKIMALQSGRRGIGAQHDPADVIKARALVTQGIYPNEGEALDALVSKPDKLYQTYKDSAMKVTMNADDAIKSAKKMMSDDGWEKSSSGTWKRAGSQGAIPQGAIDLLKKDPKTKAQFEAKYGKGSADQHLK